MLRVTGGYCRRFTATGLENMADGHGGNGRGKGKIRTVDSERIAGEEPRDRDDDRQDDAGQCAASRTKPRRVEAQQNQNRKRGTQRLSKERLVKEFS